MKAYRFQIFCFLWLMVLRPCVADSGLLAHGRMALEDGFYPEAVRIYLELLADPGSTPPVRAEAADFLLRSYAAQQDFDRIASFLADPEQAAALAADHRVYWEAVLLDRAADWAGVLARLDALPAVLPQASARVLQLRAVALLQLGRGDEAEQIFGHLTTVSTDAGQAAQSRLNWGRTLHQRAAYAEAIRVWEPLLLLTNAYPQVVAQTRYLMGQTHLREQEYAQAEAVLEPLAQQVGPEGGVLAVQALITQAQTRQLRGDLEGAGELYRAGMERLGTHPLRRRLEVAFGRMLLEAGDLDAGQEVILGYASAHLDAPEVPGLLLELGRQLIINARPAEAIAIYQRYLEAFGDPTGVARHGQGLALQGVGRFGEAAMAFEQSLQQAPEGPRREETLMLAAEARYANRQYRLALEGFEDYLRQYPGGRFSLQARYQRGGALAAQGQVDMAVQALTNMADDASADVFAAQALLRIGEIYLASEDWPAAEATFTELLQRYPEGAHFMEGLHGRGLARYHQWQAEAQSDFARVAAEADDARLREHARFMQVSIHFRLGRDEEAITESLQLLEDAPDSVWAPEVRFRLAQFAFNAGNYADAEQAFLAFVERHPDHVHAPLSLLRAGMAALELAQYVRGNETLGRMIQLFPEHALLPYARFYQAEALLQLGRYPTAILTFQEVVRLAPNTELAYLAWGREGDCHFRLGAEDAARFEAAARAYQVVLQGASVRLEDRLQAACKLGLTYEKMNRTSAALEQYYDGVIVPFHLALEGKGEGVGSVGRTWYARAVRNAAAILDRQQEWRSMVAVLERAARTDSDIAGEAARRARAVRSEYWWLFY